MGDKSSKKSSKRSRDEQPAAEAVPAAEAAPASAEAVKPKKSKKADKANTDDTTTSTAEPTEPVASTSTSADPAPAADADAAADEPEVPAMSHKEKRLAKRRKLQGLDEPTPAAAENTSKPQIGSKMAPKPGTIGAQAPAPVVGATPAKGSFGIWVGNMNFATPSKDLLAWFENRGLREITRINMPGGKRSHEANRGFAYLDFPSATDVEIAVGLSEQHLDGRKLLIKSSADFSGRPAAGAAAPLPALDPSALVPESDQAAAHPPRGAATVPGAPGQAPQTLNRTARKILDRQKNEPGPCLFVGNLGFETKAEDIREMFDAHQRAMSEWAPREKKPVLTKEEKDKLREERKAAKIAKAAAPKDEDRDSDDSDSDEEAAEEKDDEEEKEEDDDEEKGSDAEDEEDEAKPKEKAKRVRGSKKDKNAPLDLNKAKDAGIRKIRLGTFEDTGKCKGWAFIDFHLTAQATRALLNIRNHQLDGRKLNIEYASADAVRRGAIGTRAAIKAARNGAPKTNRGEASGRHVEKKGKDWDDGDMRESAKRDYFEDPEQPAEKRVRSEFGFRPTRPEGGAGRGGAKGGFGGEREREQKKGAPRAKPGAALASAQRASEGIVESTGRKITFD